MKQKTVLKREVNTFIREIEKNHDDFEHLIYMPDFTAQYAIATFNHKDVTITYKGKTIITVIDGHLTIHLTEFKPVVKYLKPLINALIDFLCEC